MAHHPQRRRHALDRAGERRRRLGLRGLQQRADFGQVLQGGELRGGAALDMAAVRQHLADDLLRQEAQRTGQEAGMLRQRDGRGDQPLQRGQRPGVEFLGRQSGRQAAGIGHQPAHQPLAEHIVGGGGEEVVVPEPGGDACADNVGPMRPPARCGGALIQSATSARARSRAASVPSARRSRSQVKLCAAARSTGDAGACRPRRPAAGARTPPPSSSSPFSSRAPRPGSPGQGSRTGSAGASGMRRHAQARQPRHRAARVAQPASRVGRRSSGGPSPRNAAIAAA